MANSITILIQAKDKASAEIDKVKSTLNAASSSQGFKSIIQGIGLGIGASAWGMVQGAMDKVVGTAEDLVKAGLEEEASQARLRASLAASVKGFSGSLDFMDKYIETGARLGFTDDDMRDSLTRLLPITKGVAEAQRVNAAAMDLARFKGISLTDASVAIGKAMEGNKKILKDLGINASDAGDAMTTLSEVEKAVAGQAEAYANTTAGALDALHARAQNLSDTVGGMLADNVGKLGYGLDVLNWQLGRSGDNTTHLGASMDEYNQHLQDVANAEAQFTRNTALADQKAKDLDLSITEGVQATARMPTPLQQAAQKARDAAAAIDTLRQRYAAYDATLAQQNELKELPLRIAVAKDEVVQAQKDLQSARTTVDKHAAALRLQQAKDELAALQHQWAGAQAIAAAQKAGAAFGKALGDGLEAAFEAATGRLNVDVRTTVHAGARALGGPVEAGGVYRVGETRPEYFIPQTAGYISPNAPQSAGGSPVTIPVILDGREVARIVDERLYWRAQLAPS
jgi:hypothetical protein